MREITSTRKHDDETRELKCPIDELECSSDETGVLKCPFRRHERTHVGSQGRFHEEKEHRRYERIHVAHHRADTAGRCGGGGMGVETRPFVIVLVCGE